MLLSRRDFVGLMAEVVPFTKLMDRIIHQPNADQNNAVELVFADADGILRWKSDNREVALFGANYCLPSACDYRAAGYVHADRKKLIEEDMAHFVRMGWDGLRLSFWGDWECCDVKGNLLVNDHLDLLDYLIAQATARGIFMLLSPIVTYSSLWPDKSEDATVIGFSKHFDRSQLGTNPEAIAAQVNYLQQLLSHVNPYTGRALKDEPNIPFVEMINEPWHHSADFEGSVRYINALVDAVRSTGCAKILFHNVSQDFGMAKPIQASKAQGSTYGWYPSGLDMRGGLHGNTLRAVDTYPHAVPPELNHKAKVVYEFDMADVMSGYHYPAMARTFRAIGAQFAAMFSYDMLATAPYNLGWQVHCLNMVYTPQKAVSAIIAGEVMRKIPRNSPYFPYPENTRFGDFRVSYEENLSEMRTPEAFLYSNDTSSHPIASSSLRKIVGYGSSPVVHYEGKGLYFLDQIEEGVWRLEVYPDAIAVRDPFLAPHADQTVFRLYAREWSMHIHLPDLGESFRATPLNAGNTYTTNAKANHFSISPGVYLLKSTRKPATASLPQTIGGVALHEFVCPAVPQDQPTSVVFTPQETYRIDQKMTFSVVVASSEAPQAVSLHIRPLHATRTAEFGMRPVGQYTYYVSVPAHTFGEGTLEYWFHVQEATTSFTYPEGGEHTHSDRQPLPPRLTATIVAANAPLILFDPDKDIGKLDVTRGSEPGMGSPGEPPIYRLPSAGVSRSKYGDVTASLYIGNRIASCGHQIRKSTALSIKMKATHSPTPVVLTLVEKDGTAWSAVVTATSESADAIVSLSRMTPAKWVLLPEGFPSDWAYWAESTRHFGQIDLANVERVQLSLRRENGPDGAHNLLSDVEIENIALLFDTIS